MPAIPPPYQQIRQEDLVHPEAISMAGASMKQLAQASGEVGQAFVRMRMAQQEANDATWLSEATARGEKDLTTSFDQFQKDNAENPEGKADAFQKQTDAMFAGIAQEAPSARARRMFQQQARTMSGQAYDNAFRWQNTQMAKNFGYRLDNVQSDLATVAMRTSNPAKLQDLYKQVDAATLAGSTFIDKGKLAELNKNMKAAVAQGYLERAVSTSPGTAIKTIDGKQFDGILDPDKQMAYRRSAHAEIKRQEAEARQKQAMARASAMQDIQGAMAALQNGQNVDVSKINFSALPADKRDLYKAAVTDLQDFAAQYNAVRYDSADDMQAAITEQRKKVEAAPPDQYKREAKQLNLLERAASQRATQLTKDPFSYVTQAPAVQEIADKLATAPADQQPALQQQFAATMVAEQQRLGVPYQNISLMAKPQAEALVASLSTPNMPTDQVVGTIQTLQKSYGQYYPYVQQQLTKAGLPTHLEVVAARAPANPAMGAKLMQAVSNQRALKDLIPTKQQNTIDENINTAMQPLAKTLRQNPNGTTKLQSYASTAKLLAMQYVADGASESDAASKAANEVVMSEYSFEHTYRIPAAFAPASGDINAAANRFMAQTVKRRQYDLPPTSEKDFETARRLADSDLKGQAYWITTADDKGLMLYHPQRGPVTYNRKPVTVSFQDLVRMQNDYRAARKAAQDKMMGGPDALGIYH